MKEKLIQRMLKGSVAVLVAAVVDRRDASRKKWIDVREE